MKLTLVTIIGAAFIAAQCNASSLGLISNWEKFKAEHNKQYSLSENSLRYAIYRENLKAIDAHNALYEQGLTSYKMGVNQFTDMTHQEFLDYLTRFKINPNSQSSNVLPFELDGDVPETVDWRNKSVVTPVKDQGSCGSCWSFSVTGTLEGQNALKTGKLVSYSEQQLVDCSGSFGTGGCDGGWPDDALDYVKANGIATEASYGYEGVDGTCSYTPAEKVLSITGRVDLPVANETALKIAAANIGPISVCLDASDWFAYESGIFYESSCATDVFNHAVLIVGYGSENGQDYWLIKNSWGPSWGLEGYIKLARNRQNQCGVSSKAVYPVL